MSKNLQLLKEYEAGLSFKKGDILRAKAGIQEHSKSASGEWIVLEQDCLAPHEYTVLGEREKYQKPEDRFIKTVINGHNYEKV